MKQSLLVVVSFTDYNIA